MSFAPAHRLGEWNGGPTDADRAHWRVHIGQRIRDAWSEAAEPEEQRRRLASALRISRERLWEVEGGVVPLDTVDLASAAEALGVHPGYFFDAGPLSAWTKGHPHGDAPTALETQILQLGEQARQDLASLACLLETGSGQRRRA